jgi:autotransporter-associated beta strand protein
MRLARVSGEGYARLAQEVYLEAGESYLATAVFDGEVSLFSSGLELWNSPSAVVVNYEASSDGRTIRQATLVPAQTGMYTFLFALWDPGSVDVISMSLVRASTGEELVGDPSFARGISDWRSAGGVIEWLGGDRGLPVDRPVSVGSGTSEFEVVPRIGSERLVKNGDGTLILGQASASTGGVVVRAGELVVTNSQSLGTGGLWVRPGATVRFDNGAGDIALTALDVQDIGKVDLGQTRISLPAGAADVASVREAIKAGQKGWGPYQTYGLMTSQASPSTGRGLGYSVDGEGNLTVGYAAAGDGNLDGIVDIFDLSRLVASGKFGQGTAAEWYEGDFNYDGTFNSFDLTQLVSGGLFQRGSYMAGPGSLATGSEAMAANTASLRVITQLSAIDSFTWAAIATLSETDAPAGRRAKGSGARTQQFAHYASPWDEFR